MHSLFVSLRISPHKSADSAIFILLGIVRLLTAALMPVLQGEFTPALRNAFSF